MVSDFRRYSGRPVRVCGGLGVQQSHKCSSFFPLLLKIGYYEPFGADHGHGSSPIRMAEAPLTMVVPLLIVAGGLVVMGVYTGDIVTNIIEPIIPPAIGN